MPFAVRQWPVAPDPRSPLFSFAGWNWGQVLPIQWILSSVGALSPWTWLNDGIVLAITADDGLDTRWTGFSPPVDNVTVTLDKFGTEAPAGAPPFTIEWKILMVRVPPLLDVFGGEKLLFPDAIRTFGPWAAFDSGGPVTEIPNGLDITPAKWNFVLP